MYTFYVHVPMLASLYNHCCVFPVCILRMYVYCARSTSVVPLCPAGSNWGDDDTTRAVCAWTVLADSDMSPVYTLPLVLCALVMCYLQMRHPLRDWTKLGTCKVIQHSPEDGVYYGVAVNSECHLAVTDNANKCVHIFSKKGALLRSIGKSVLGGDLRGISFDLKASVWVTEKSSCKVLKLSQDGELLLTIDHAGNERDRFYCPTGVSVSPEGLVYICDTGNHRVTVHDEEGMFLFAFGSNGSGPGCFDEPRDVTFGTDGLVYVTDHGNRRVGVWSKEGSLERGFKTKYIPSYIAATGDNHLLITSWTSHTVMVYTSIGRPVHEFRGRRCGLGMIGALFSFNWEFEGPYGICVDDSGAVYVADYDNRCMQVF